MQPAEMEEEVKVVTRKTYNYLSCNREHPENRSQDRQDMEGVAAWEVWPYRWLR